MNYSSINSRGVIDKTDIVGIYGQNGSGKTVLVESLDILQYIIRGFAVPYETYAGLLQENPVSITTAFFIEKGLSEYKVNYVVYIKANDEKKKIEIYKEKLTYWTRGASWKLERDLEFENPCYSNTDLLEQRSMSIVSEHRNHLNGISFLASMQNLALICAQQFVSVFLTRWF